MNHFPFFEPIFYRSINVKFLTKNCRTLDGLFCQPQPINDLSEELKYEQVKDEQSHALAILKQRAPIIMQ